MFHAARFVCGRPPPLLVAGRPAAQPIRGSGSLDPSPSSFSPPTNTQVYIQLLVSPKRREGAKKKTRREVSRYLLSTFFFLGRGFADISSHPLFWRHFTACVICADSSSPPPPLRRILCNQLTFSSLAEGASILGFFWERRWRRWVGGGAEAISSFAPGRYFKTGEERKRENVCPTYGPSPPPPPSACPEGGPAGNQESEGPFAPPPSPFPPSAAMTIIEPPCKPPSSLSLRTDQSRHGGKSHPPPVHFHSTYILSNPLTLAHC